MQPEPEHHVTVGRSIWSGLDASDACAVTRHILLHTLNTYADACGSHPCERGSAGAVRAAGARSGGASAAVWRAIAARAPLRRAPLGTQRAAAVAPSRIGALGEAADAVAAALRGRQLVDASPAARAAHVVALPHARGEAGGRKQRSRGGPPSRVGGPPREGYEPTSPEPPATSLAGGARGCGVELEVRGDFRPCASDVRSARVERERLAGTRAEGRKE